jgi:rhamnose transport system ATP-binding protein
MLLRLDAISKSFGGVQALKDVSFDLQPGEVHALVGENGAGKSTLIKIITGAVQPDSGIIELDNQTLAKLDPVTARRLGIAAIYQHPALFPDLSVAENMALGIERAHSLARIDWPARRARARELLARVGASIKPESIAGDLTMPEQQLVEIARALGAGARVLIMDEPTASLSDREIERFFAVIKQLKESGVGIVYISHRLDELPRIADRVTVLRDGARIDTRPIAELEKSELIRLMVGRELTAVFPKQTVPIGEPILELRSLGCGALGIRDVDLTIRSGEIMGLAGLVGSGRTQLAQVLFGLAPADAGRILLHGKPVEIDSPQRAIDLGIAYVPEDRRRHGVIAEMPVAANASLAVLRRLAGRGRLNFAREKVLAGELASRLAIKTPSIRTPAGHLSGGNQQKVAVARWLATNPKVLILDEPTQGIDVGAKAEIHRLMGDLARRGLAILLISSELPEILGMSDRVAIMRGGTIQSVVDRCDATPERILTDAFGQVAT